MRCIRRIGLPLLGLLCLGLTLALWQRGDDAPAAAVASRSPDQVMTVPVEVIVVGEAPDRREIQVAR